MWHVAPSTASMLDGKVYLNVHSTAHPGGVIRGQVE